MGAESTKLKPELHLTSHQKRLLSRTWHSHIKDNEQIGYTAFDKYVIVGTHSCSSIGLLWDLLGGVWLEMLTVMTPQCLAELRISLYLFIFTSVNFFEGAPR